MANLNISSNTKLEHLDFSYNSVKSLDIYNCTNLSYLNCERNPIQNLDLSKNIKLQYLNLNDNRLKTLDVYQNILLQTLECNSNELSDLNVTSNTNLERLGFLANHILGINLNNNKKLKSLDCSANPLTDLNIYNNSELEFLQCIGTEIQGLYLDNNKKLIGIMCNSNPELTSVSLKNGQNSKIMGFDSTNNPNLNCIQVDEVVYSNTNWPDKDSWAIYSTNCSLGINETKKNSIQIYPNPVKEKFIINTNEKIEIVEIYSQTGQLLKTAKSKEINISTLPKGNYILKVKTNKENITQKIIKE